MSLLAVRDLTVRYGALEAARGVSFALEEGEALALIGFVVFILLKFA